MSLYPIKTVYRSLAWCAGLGLAILIGGCTSPKLERRMEDIPRGEVYKPANLFAVPELPPGFRRVAVLPVFIPGKSEADPEEMAAILLTELRRTGRFEIVEVTPETLFRVSGVSQLSTLAPFPASLLAYVRNQLQADGVMQMDLTAFRPYRPFEVGIRSRLSDNDTGSPLWAVDEIFNAGNQEVVTGARNYSLGEIQQKYPYGDSYSALRSAHRFTAYAAYTLFRTLPGFFPN